MWIAAGLVAIILASLVAHNTLSSRGAREDGEPTSADGERKLAPASDDGRASAAAYLKLAEKSEAEGDRNAAWYYGRAAEWAEREGNAAAAQRFREKAVSLAPR
jgi:hypothetical protein